MQNERYIAAADIGSAKTALCVAKVEGDDVQVIFYRETPSEGVRYSSVLNYKKAAAPLKRLVEAAEGELNIKIHQVVVGLPRYRIRQEVSSALNPNRQGNEAITEEEISDMKNNAINDYPLDDDSRDAIYGVAVQSFNADDYLVGVNEDDVIGAAADKLEGNFKIFIGDKRPMDNLYMSLNDISVACASTCFPATAVASAVLTEAEKENGVALIEVGAGVTSLTIYRGGRLRYYASIPFGGKSVTDDIKSECGFTAVLAENIKLAYASCLPEKLHSESDKVLLINDEENGSSERLPIKYLSEIVTARMKEIFTAMLFLIQESGYEDKLRNGVVLTGGGANLVNAGQLLKDMSGYNVRKGFPRTQTFSSGGCIGATEASAAECIGMILEARKAQINCIESAPVVEQEPEQEVNVTEVDLIDKKEFGDEVKPEPKKPRKSRSGFSWTKKFSRKVESLGESIFDSTLGSAYDSMD